MAREKRTTARGRPRGPGAAATLPADPLDPGLCIFRHVTRTSRAVAALYDQRLSRASLTGQQFNLLMTLSRLGPAPVGELARRVGMDPSTVPRVAAPLLRERMLVVGPGAQDRRVRIVRLTPRGRRALERAMPLWREAQRMMLADLGADAWPPLVGQLAAVRAAARRIAGDDGASR